MLVFPLQNFGCSNWIWSAERFFFVIGSETLVEVLTCTFPGWLGPEDWRETLLVAEVVLGVVVRFKNGKFSYAYNTYLDLIHAYPKYTKRLLPYPAITSKMEVCISWEDKQVSCFLPPANLFLTYYGLHYCIKSPFGSIQISRDFSFINSHLRSEKGTSTLD